MPYMPGTLCLPQVVHKTIWKGQPHWFNYRYLNTLQYKSWGQSGDKGTLSSRIATYHYIKLYTYLKVFIWLNGSSLLKVISPEYSLEGLMLKLKLQYFGHLMWRADTLEKTLMMGKIECKRRQKRVAEAEIIRWHHWLSGHESEQTLGDGEGQRSLECCSPQGHKESDTT